MRSPLVLTLPSSISLRIFGRMVTASVPRDAATYVHSVSGTPGSSLRPQSQSTLHRRTAARDLDLSASTIVRVPSSAISISVEYSPAARASSPTDNLRASRACFRRAPTTSQSVELFELGICGTLGRGDGADSSGRSQVLQSWRYAQSRSPTAAESPLVS